MGAPAVVAGDEVRGVCPNHVVPAPNGAPVPAPPLPFSAPLTQNLATSVLIEGKPAAIEGSSGYNFPPHIGIHPSDPYVGPMQQVGQVRSGSKSVSIEGSGAAMSGCLCTCCLVPGMVVGSAASVLIGP